MNFADSILKDHLLEQSVTEWGDKIASPSDTLRLEAGVGGRGLGLIPR